MGGVDTMGTVSMKISVRCGLPVPQGYRVFRQARLLILFLPFPFPATLLLTLGQVIQAIAKLNKVMFFWTTCNGRLENTPLRSGDKSHGCSTTLRPTRPA